MNQADQRSETNRPKQHRGFAAMSPELQRTLASRGGKRCQALGVGHRWDSAEATRAASKGVHLASFPWPTDGTIWDRFWSLVERTDGCWLWRGPISKAGYGRCGVWGLPHHAYRAAWELTCGPILHNLFVLHRCDNRACVRPDHLFLGTSADNMDDCARKGRFRAGPNWTPTMNR